MKYWAVRAELDGIDKTEEFIEQEIWETLYKEDYTPLIKSIQTGDLIAIKSLRFQKHDLPFDSHHCRVSCMDVYAIGTVIENMGDGKRLRVNWQPQYAQKTIYWTTYSPAVIEIKSRQAQKYIFENVEQDFSVLEKYYRKKSARNDEPISDEFILSQFRAVQNFKFIERDEIQKTLFLRLARYVHTAPMDWWITSSNQVHPVRFGVNNQYHGRNSTRGYVAAVGFDEQGTFYVPNDMAYFADQQGAVRLTKTSMQDLEQIEFEKMDIDRDPFVGYWPEDYQQEQEQQESEMNTPPILKDLNRILFGAAGTGKTYHTINHALSILDHKSLEELEHEDRTKLKADFDCYIEQGRIKFVTFHQSFSYEDFVEGIRAEVDVESDQLTYAVKSGVFKDICEKASGQHLQFHNNENSLDSFLEEISLKPMVLNTIKNKEFKVSYIGHGHVIHCQPMASENNATYRANINSIREILQGSEPEILYNSSYVYAIANFIKQKYKPTEIKEKFLEPYVLIIDEINRGNISRIFGELITLIEDSKRKYAEEELSVTLPYSKKVFSVPSNVYIIGTMNSSDRSLTGLDIALRRRFTFIEMPPKPELLNDISVEGLNIGALLKVMNQRIEVLLDRDHCIGHANFMSLKNKPILEHLTEIFKQKIIPQLQEYFFDDWAKINLVLFNNGMLVEDHSLNLADLFPANFEQELGYANEKTIWKINPEAFKTIDAFHQILGLKG